jgi:hypothetical protein
MQLWSDAISNDRQRRSLSLQCHGVWCACVLSACACGQRRSRLRWLDQSPPTAATMAMTTTRSVCSSKRQVRGQRRRTAKRQLREHQLPSQRQARLLPASALLERHSGGSKLLQESWFRLQETYFTLQESWFRLQRRQGSPPAASPAGGETNAPACKRTPREAPRQQQAPAESEQRGKPRSAASGSSGGNATAARNPEASRRIISPARATSGGEARGSGNDNKVVRLRQRAGRRWQVALRQRWWRAHQRRRPREWRLPKWHRRSGRRSGDEAERPATRASDFGATAATGGAAAKQSDAAGGGACEHWVTRPVRAAS